MSRVLALARFATIVVAVGAAIVVASALPSTGEGSTRGALAASLAPELEIAPLDAPTWGRAAEGDWILENAQPGDEVAGGVWLRTVALDDRDHDSAALTFGLRDPRPSPLLEAIEVTAMSLGGVDVLPRWTACRDGGGALTLAGVARCSTPPALPVPEAEGSRFEMTLRLAPGAPNEVQGASTGPLLFTFTLRGGAPDAAPGGDTAPPDAGAPGDGAPDDGAPDDGAVPPPGSTGHGLLAPARAPVLAAAALIALLLVITVRGRPHP